MNGDDAENLIPGAPATPWRPSLHQLYEGKPSRETPGALLITGQFQSFDIILFCNTCLTIFASFSLDCMAWIIADALSAGEAVTSHTLLVLRGPLTQSGKPALDASDANNTNPAIYADVGDFMAGRFWLGP